MSRASSDGAVLDTRISSVLEFDVNYQADTPETSPSIARPVLPPIGSTIFPHDPASPPAAPTAKTSIAKPGTFSVSPSRAVPKLNPPKRNRTNSDPSKIQPCGGLSIPQSDNDEASSTKNYTVSKSQKPPRSKKPGHGKSSLDDIPSVPNTPRESKFDLSCHLGLLLTSPIEPNWTHVLNTASLRTSFHGSIQMAWPLRKMTPTSLEIRRSLRFSCLLFSRCRTHRRYAKVPHADPCRNVGTQCRIPFKISSSAHHSC